MNGPRLAWDVLRAEGAAGFCDRLRDRLAFRRRQRSFKLVGEVLNPARLETPRSAPVPILNVLPTAPRPDFGGVQVQLTRRLEAEAELRPWALLYPQAAGYRLEIRDGQRREALIYRVDVGLAPERLREPIFGAVVCHATKWLGAGTVHFEQLVTLPLETVAELRESGLALVVSVHDFGLFCVRPHLMERPRMRFCGFCRVAPRCALCLSQDWDVGEGFQERRRRIAGNLLRSADAVIYPSDYLRRTYADLMPGLDQKRQHVVEPPSVDGPTQTTAAEPRPRVRHLAYVGSVKPHKGALIFEELIRTFSPEHYPDLRWSVYGGGDRDVLGRLRQLPGVRLRGYYRAGELPGKLRRDGVDLALLLSVWPESYALTFDECLLAGVPVLAFDQGAVADRLRRYSAGVPVDPSVGQAGLGAALAALLEEGFHPAPPPPAFTPPDGASAAGACLRLYEALGQA